MNYITPIKELLDKQMHNICVLFCTIGTPIESPRWFNYRKIDRELNTLTIGSTQRQALYFTIKADYFVEYVEVNEFWNQFKEYRTEFLQTNYPTIKTI